MKAYYKNISCEVKICYLISSVAFVLIFFVSLVLFLNVSPVSVRTVKTIWSVFAGIIVIIAVLIISNVMSKAMISTEHNLFGSMEFFTQVKFAGLIMVYFVGGCAVAQAVGGHILSATVGIALNSLRDSSFPLFSFIIKAILYTLFLAALAVLTRRVGYRDSPEREFNPHLLFVSIVLALALLMPGTVYGHMYENEDEKGSGILEQIDLGSRGKASYNLQAVLNKNENLYTNMNSSKIKTNQNFSVVLVIAGILTSSFVQIAVGVIFYFEGQKDFYSRYPRLYNEHFSSNDYEMLL